MEIHHVYHLDHYDMATLTAIIIASVLEGIISFSGVVLLLWNEARIRSFLRTILSFAVGGLLGAAFLEILPEAIEAGDAPAVLGWTLFSILFFFILEKMLVWYHHHEEGHVPHEHSPGYLVLIGDLIHNAIDGVAIALSFMASFELGVAATIAVLIHEVPTEVGDFLVLLHSGFSRARAMWYNFAVSLSTIAAALLTYAFGPALEPYMPVALALVAGNFIYIAIADLMPELQERAGWKHTLAQVTLLILGVVLVGSEYFFK